MNNKWQRTNGGQRLADREDASGFTSGILLQKMGLTRRGMTGYSKVWNGRKLLGSYWLKGMKRTLIGCLFNRTKPYCSLACPVGKKCAKLKIELSDIYRLPSLLNYPFGPNRRQIVFYYPKYEAMTVTVILLHKMGHLIAWHAWVQNVLKCCFCFLSIFWAVVFGTDKPLFSRLFKKQTKRDGTYSNTFLKLLLSKVSRFFSLNRP